MSVQNLVSELAREYTESKYEKKHLEERISEILEALLPGIAAIAESKKEREPVNLWNALKEDEKVKDLFRKALERIERPIVIYVASKFENNKHFGTRIIEEALEWK